MQGSDTFPSPVISALDAELTCLQKSWGPPAPARLANVSWISKAGFRVLTMFSTFQIVETYMVFVLNKAWSDLHRQRCHQSCVSPSAGLYVCVCLSACLDVWLSGCLAVSLFVCVFMYVKFIKCAPMFVAASELTESQQCRCKISSGCPTSRTCRMFQWTGRHCRHPGRVPRWTLV